MSDTAETEHMESVVERVLVPVDGTAVDAVDYAVAIADSYDATVHAVFVLSESTVRDLETGVTDRDRVADRTADVLEGVRATCDAADLPVSTAMTYGFSTRRKRRHPGSAILDTAEDIDADFLVVPREEDHTTGVLARVAKFVLQYASQPVLSV